MTDKSSETGRGRRQVVRRSIAERERLLAEFDKLGISQAEFARRKDALLGSDPDKHLFINTLCRENVCF